MWSFPKTQIRHKFGLIGFTKILKEPLQGRVLVLNLRNPFDHAAGVLTSVSVTLMTCYVHGCLKMDFLVPKWLRSPQLRSCHPYQIPDTINNELVWPIDVAIAITIIKRGLWRSPRAIRLPASEGRNVVEIPGGIEDPGGLAPNQNRKTRLLIPEGDLINRKPCLYDLVQKPKPRKTLHRTVSYEFNSRFKNDTRASATERI
jgi:hypothetical protein